MRTFHRAWWRSRRPERCSRHHGPTRAASKAPRSRKACSDKRSPAHSRSGPRNHAPMGAAKPDLGRPAKSDAGRYVLATAPSTLLRRPPETLSGRARRQVPAPADAVLLERPDAKGARGHAPRGAGGAALVDVGREKERRVDAERHARRPSGADQFLQAWAPHRHHQGIRLSARARGWRHGRRAATISSRLATMSSKSAR